MNDDGKRQAWADFWLNEQSPNSQGCLAGATGELGAVQASTWRQFASSLPRNGRILDLATGNGIVLMHLRQARPDLRLTGVDSARGLPKARAGMHLIAGVEIESLPFEKSSIDAVTSQFGYEYGETSKAATEVARVLKHGGSFLFIIHDRSSPVVSHNSDRSVALRWAGVESGLLEKARAIANARRTLPFPTPAHFKVVVGEAAQRYSGQSVAAEFARAVLQALEPGIAPSASLAHLDLLESKMRSELARLEALSAAARDEPGIGELVRELEDAGLEVQPKRQMTSQAGVPFAWELSGCAPD